MVINQQAQKGEGTDRVSQVVLWLTGAPTLMKKKLPIFNNLSGDRKNVVVGLTTENNRDAKKKKKEVAQKDSTLQPITKVNSKLDKELQEWDVDSTEAGD